jgi:hypothetical protein
MPAPCGISACITVVAEHQLASFTADGLMLARSTPSSPPDPELGPGATRSYSTADHGAWVAAGSGQVRFTLVEVQTDEQARFANLVRITGTLTLAADGNSFRGGFQIVFTDAAGAVAVANPSVGQAPALLLGATRRLAPRRGLASVLAAGRAAGNLFGRDFGLPISNPGTYAATADKRRGPMQVSAATLRRTVTVTALFVAICLAAGLLYARPAAARGGPHPIKPKLLFDGINECGSVAGNTAVATGNPFECDYVTTATIAAGGTLTLTITNPPGTVFNAVDPVVPASLPAGCAAAGGGTQVLVISCAAAVPSPQLIETQLVGGPIPGLITMTAAYSGGPTVTNITFLYQYDTTIPPSPTNVVTLGADPGTIASIACSNTTPGKAAGAPIQVGDTFACVVSFSAPNSPSAVVIDGFGFAPPPGAATYTLSGTVMDTLGETNYLCGNAQTNTPCTTFTITGTATSNGPLAFGLEPFNLGAAVDYQLPFTFTPTTVPPVTGPAGAIVGGALGVRPIFAALGCANANDAGASI